MECITLLEQFRWTDCSGLGAPPCALRNLGVAFAVLAGSDSDKVVANFWKTHWGASGATFFEDLTTRSHASAVAELGHLDLYCACSLARPSAQRDPGVSINSSRTTYCPYHSAFAEGIAHKLHLGKCLRVVA